MQRFLIIRLSALGDVIHTLPAVVALRDALGGDAALTWVIEPAYAELVATVAQIETAPLSMKRWRRSLLRSSKEIAAARRKIRGYDISVDFQGLVKSAMLGAFSGAAVRWGFDAAAVRERAALFFTNRRASIDRTRHVVEWNLQLASAVAGRSLELRAVDFSSFASDPGERLAPFRGQIILLPGAGKVAKQWPVSHFRTLLSLTDHPAAVVWGPGEETLAREIGASVVPPTSLRELAALLRDARLVIGGDTGPLHLAAALGTPVIGLYGPTDPGRNGPYAQTDSVVSAYADTRSMEAIDPRLVAEAVRQRLR